MSFLTSLFNRKNSGKPVFGEQITGIKWYENKAWQGELIYLGGDYFCSIRSSTLLFQYHQHLGELWSVCYTENKRFVLIGTFWRDGDGHLPSQGVVARVLPPYAVRELFFAVSPKYLCSRHPKFVVNSRNA